MREKGWIMKGKARERGREERGGGGGKGRYRERQSRYLIGCKRYTAGTAFSSS